MFLLLTYMYAHMHYNVPANDNQPQQQDSKKAPTEEIGKDNTLPHRHPQIQKGFILEHANSHASRYQLSSDYPTMGVDKTHGHDRRPSTSPTPFLLANSGVADPVENGAFCLYSIHEYSALLSIDYHGVGDHS
ncbi:uncharacterized protein CLUP02_03565 [Colletotrichum lupini]|uniref:Uncharacterized protein n=1 Tax=Colletotrichum lupini TaxID=145971 RepID=A0A9Q8SIQ6_9PEZI|nr:uncharacterized protein CLUP02_03565 [Colletotrichum lupini]UQC78091.1 hypothetical protein CLUP02_03565 [Colletotrichum lupini]